MKNLLISAAVVVCVSTSAMATTLTDTYTSLVVFGDSLSDNGNLFAAIGSPPAPYVDGKFSNGPVWNEAIAAEISAVHGSFQPDARFGVTGNLSFGGARADTDTNDQGPIPSVQTQLGIFLGSGGSFASDTLVSLWAGANDIFQDLELATGTAVGTETAGDVEARLGELIGSGARNLLVFNLPDIGATPAYDADPLQGDATDATIAFNAGLGAAIDRYEILDPTLNIMEVDVFAIFNTIIDTPTDFGIANAQDACIFELSCVFGDAAVQNSFLFWDGVHPTTTGHNLIEAAARQALAPSVVPLPAGAPLYFLAMFGLGLVARRRS